MNKRTECYLKVGQRPRLGANHVRRFLNHLGSETERPETKIKKAERLKTERAKQDQDEEKVVIKDISTSKTKTRSTRNLTSMKAAIDVLEQSPTQLVDETIISDVGTLS